jgi:hypothetical protein
VIPIADLLVETGLITSLARPGGNLSGVDFPELTAKRLERLRDLIPAARRVALLHDPQSTTVEHLTAITVAAERLGFITEVVEARRPEQIAEALQQARAGDAEAVNAINSPLRRSRPSCPPAAKAYRDALQITRQSPTKPLELPGHRLPVFSGEPGLPSYQWNSRGSSSC